MKPTRSIRKAKSGDASALSELALRSKGHWGYSDEFLDACRDELTIDPAKLDSREFEAHVAVGNDVILGFYAIAELSITSFELDALFVEPEHIGAGVGRELLQHALRNLAAKGAETLLIQGDPNASRFYEAAGAHLVGSRESGSIPGRELPLYELDIGTAATINAC